MYGQQQVIFYILAVIDGGLSVTVACRCVHRRSRLSKNDCLGSNMYMSLKWCSILSHPSDPCTYVFKRKPALRFKTGLSHTSGLGSAVCKPLRAPWIPQQAPSQPPPRLPVQREFIDALSKLDIRYIFERAIKEQTAQAQEAGVEGRMCPCHKEGHEST